MSEDRDPDLAGLSEVAQAGTVFDEIRAEMARRSTDQVATETYVLTRWPEWEVTYRLPATAQELSKIGKAVAKKVKTDAAAFNRLLLANCCVALSYAGKPLVEDDGTPMTWASPTVRAMLGATGSTEALTAAYRGGNPAGAGDGELSSHADELTSLAGFGDDSQVWKAGDPTPAQ